MPSGSRPDLVNRFLEELSSSLDLQQTIKKLNIPEDRARDILKGLIRPVPGPSVQKDLFDEQAQEARAVLRGAPKAAREAPVSAHEVRPGGVYTINVDGASRGNPGEAGAGAVITGPEGTVLKKLKKYLGIVTNNVAEYQALVMALEAARSLKLERIRVLADSELMVKQVNGVYKVKSPDLKPLHEKAVGLLRGFRESKVAHVYREHNGGADSMANEAIDGFVKKG